MCLLLHMFWNKPVTNEAILQSYILLRVRHRHHLERTKSFLLGYILVMKNLAYMYLTQRNSLVNTFQSNDVDFHGKQQHIQLQWNISVALLPKRNVFPTLTWQRFEPGAPCIWTKVAKFRLYLLFHLNCAFLRVTSGQSSNQRLA